MTTLTFSKPILEKPQANLLIAMRLSNVRLYRLAQALLWFAEGVSIKGIGRCENDCHLDKNLHVQRHFLVDRPVLPRPWAQGHAVQGAAAAVGGADKGRS